MISLSMNLSDLWPHFKVTTFFEVEYHKKGASERQSYMEWYYVCWPRLTAKSVAPVVSISWASCCTLLRIDVLAKFYRFANGMAGVCFLDSGEDSTCYRLSLSLYVCVLWARAVCPVWHTSLNKQQQSRLRTCIFVLFRSSSATFRTMKQAESGFVGWSTT